MGIKQEGGGKVLDIANIEMHLSLKIAFFSASDGGTSLTGTPFSLQWSKFYDSSSKGIKQKKVGGKDTIIITNIFLGKYNGLSVKCFKKLCTKLCELSFKN